MQKVPDFFQTDTAAARARQLSWLKARFGLGEEFLSRSLRIDPDLIRELLKGKGEPTTEQQEHLRLLWAMFTHLLALLNFDFKRVRMLLETPAAEPQDSAGPVPPWTGRSIKRYLEDKGTNGIGDVNRWVTSFRFTNRYPIEHPERSREWHYRTR